MSDSVRGVLVFGAGGQVGRALATRMVPGFAIVGLGRADADITQRDAVDSAVRRHRPDIIINAAAYTAVDKAEFDLDRVFAVNETGTRNIALAARDTGAVLIHLSTDYVFDGGSARPYVEDDPMAPISAYGRSKAAAELEIRDSVMRHVIVRTAWLYDAHGPNFLATMIRLARERDVVRVVADQHGSPTAVGDLADGILAMLSRLLTEDAVFGTFHLTNAGRTTWHGFAQEIFAGLARHEGRVGRLEAITTADYACPARRPLMSVLDCDKIADVYGIRLRPWKDALAATLDTVLALELERGSR